MNYEDYKKSISGDVENLISKMHCQPVLFLGSGISYRYFGAPNWNGLLQLLADRCPEIDKDFAYYAQSCSSEPQIGSVFADHYREWAWSGGRNSFPDELFQPDISPELFLKHQTAELIKEFTPSSIGQVDPEHLPEIEALRNIKPHAVLTTNYDTFLETVFQDYAVIVGQTALKGMPFAVGEIFKFHGCVNFVDQIVLTQEDYEIFSKKKKFIAARLLSLFNEHPLLIAGYGAGDSNIKALLSDIDEALALPGSLIENIYFLEFKDVAESLDDIPREKLIQIEDNRSVRVKLIVASDFEWVFDAFSSPESLHNVPPSTMRAILARSYELVRTDIPRKKLEVDFDMLEHRIQDSENFAKLFGITTINDGSALSEKYYLTPTDIGKELGGTNWHECNKQISVIEQHTGIDLKSFDSVYHHLYKSNKSTAHKYSREMLDLLIKVKQHGFCELEWLDEAVWPD